MAIVSTRVDIQFRLMDETKGTFKYQESDKDGSSTPYAYQRIGVLYVKKRVFNNKPAPKTLTVTLTFDQDNEA